jgi:membrane protease YdiL (CAAX protease family)
MPEIPAADEVLTAVPVGPRIGRPLLAWCAIILLILTILASHRFIPSKYGETQTAPDSGLLAVRLQGRILVGAKQLLLSAGNDTKMLGPQLDALNTGPAEQRLRVAILAGELEGPQAALTKLQDLEKQEEEQSRSLTPTESALKTTLSRLYGDYAKGELGAPSLSYHAREFLHREMGWFGDLALAPKDGPNPAAREEVLQPALRALWAFVGLGMVFGVLGLFGLFALILFLIFLFRGNLLRGVQPGVSHGAVYAEAFALYLFVYFGLSLAFSFLPVEGARLLLAGLAAVLSLGVLGWPVLRGVPWRQVRQDIGLIGGRQPALEPLIGLGGYAMAIPLLFLGVLVMLVLMRIEALLHGASSPQDSLSPENLPHHPIEQFLVGSDWFARFQIFLLACIIAPVVEEIMFRGVLYRHLREASFKWGFGASLLFSALLASFVFAVIHPQGLVAVPPLMALAVAFTLVREWRGTLVPGMVAHGLNNGLILTVVLLATGD